MAGIDQDRLEGILGGTKVQQPATGLDHIFNNVKMEDTFLMVRDGEGEHGNDDPLNDISMGIDPAMRLMPEDQPMDGSAFRNIPDDAEGFEQALLRGGDMEFDQPALGGAGLEQVGFLD